MEMGSQHYASAALPRGNSQPPIVQEPCEFKGFSVVFLKPEFGKSKINAIINVAKKINKGKWINIQSGVIVLRAESDVRSPRKCCLRCKRTFSLHGIGLQFRLHCFVFINL